MQGIVELEETQLDVEVVRAALQGKLHEADAVDHCLVVSQWSGLH